MHGMLFSREDSMSSMTVKDWEDFIAGINNEVLWPDCVPTIKCLEDLAMAAKAVSKSFWETALWLKNEDGFECFGDVNKFKYGKPVWYRGDADWQEGWSLTPSIYRPKYRLNGDRSAEKWMLNDFWRRAVLRDRYCPEPERLAAWLALAQHHLLPTRLLDWSETITTAAWFATHDDDNARITRKTGIVLSELMDKVRASGHRDLGAFVKALEEDEGRREAVKAAGSQKSSQTVIWALSPTLLNWHFRRDGPYFFMDSKTDIVRQAFGDGAKDIEKVLAVWQQDVHPRMMMQSGVFTIHSTDECLRVLNENAAPRERFLRKLVVDREERTILSGELRTMGVNASTVFPDLEHLAQHIREIWQDISKQVET
jgi:FRG domain